MDSSSERMNQGNLKDHLPRYFLRSLFLWINYFKKVNTFVGLEKPTMVNRFKNVIYSKKTSGKTLLLLPEGISFRYYAI